MAENRAADTAYIKVKVVGQDEQAVTISIKYDAYMRSLKKKYARRLGYDLGTLANDLQLYFDKMLINDKHTPRSLGLEKNSLIEAFHAASLPKPAPTENDFQRMKLIVQGESETILRVKNGISMHKLKKSYAELTGVNKTSLSFLYDGRFIVDKDTPLSLGVEEDDIIEVHHDDLTAQSRSRNRPQPAEFLTLKVVGQNSHEDYFRVRNGMQMRKLKKNFADRYGMNVTSLLFRFEGRRIEDDDTPKSLEMTDDSSIQLYWEKLPPFDLTIEDEPTAANVIHLKVIGTDSEVHFHVTKATPMKDIRAAYADRFGFKETAFCFRFNRIQIGNSDTPESLGMSRVAYIGVGWNHTLPFIQGIMRHRPALAKGDFIMLETCVQPKSSKRSLPTWTLYGDNEDQKEKKEVERNIVQKVEELLKANVVESTIVKTDEKTESMEEEEPKKSAEESHKVGRPSMDQARSSKAHRSESKEKGNMKRQKVMEADDSKEEKKESKVKVGRPSKKTKSSKENMSAKNKRMAAAQIMPKRRATSTRLDPVLREVEEKKKVEKKSNVPESPDGMKRSSGRSRKRPAWMKDYNLGEEEEVEEKKRKTSSIHNLRR